MESRAKKPLMSANHVFSPNVRQNPMTITAEDRFSSELVHRPSKLEINGAVTTAGDRQDALAVMHEVEAAPSATIQATSGLIDEATRQHSQPTIRLLAQTSGENVTRNEAQRREPPVPPRDSFFYTSAQWTADGTSIITTSSDQRVSAFILPSDLLQEADKPQQLEPQASFKLPESTQALALAPYFSLADPTTQLLLVGCRDHPLHLYHAFPQSGDEAGSHTPIADSTARPLYTYKLIRKESEQYITPSSLVWDHPGTHFICGSANRLDLFDVSRHGSDGPVLTVPTIPSRRHISKGSGVGMKGTIAALASSPHAGDGGSGSLLAAGTWTRWMGLYDLHHTDRVVANWSIAGADGEAFRTNLGGQGIVQTVWSPCGRYLVINERQASGLLVYDIRGTGQLLSILQGRISTTQQRLRCNVFQGETGFEVWAGAQDGSIAVWENVGNANDVVEPSWSWKGHESPVGSAIVHSSGSVVATCSGGWGHDHGVGRDSEQVLGWTEVELRRSRIFEESSLRVWSVGGGEKDVED